MKLLKIDSNCGHFLNKDGQYEPIDKIGKDDLLNMVQKILNGEWEVDEYDESLIKNLAHQVVYKSIYNNLDALAKRKDEFLDESDRMYLEDYKRYVGDSPQAAGIADKSND